MVQRLVGRSVDVSLGVWIRVFFRRVLSGIGKGDLTASFVDFMSLFKIVFWYRYQWPRVSPVGLWNRARLIMFYLFVFFFFVSATIVYLFDCVHVLLFFRVLCLLLCFTRFLCVFLFNVFIKVFMCLFFTFLLIMFCYQLSIYVFPSLLVDSCSYEQCFGI